MPENNRPAIFAMWASVLIFLSLTLYLAIFHQIGSTVDGGAYGLSALHVQGLETTGTDFVRPPFAPGWLLVPFIAVFGFYQGISLFSWVALIPFILSFILFSGLFLKGWPRTIVVILILLDLELAEMWAAGDLPMIGFSLMLLMLWALISGKGRYQKAILVVCPTVIALVNQTSVGVSAILLGVIILVMAVKYREFWPLPYLMLGGLFALAIAWPWYLNVLPGSESTRYPGPVLTTYGTANYEWPQGFLALFIAGLAIATLRDRRIVLAGSLLIITGILGVLYSFDESVMNIVYRGHYLTQPFAYILGSMLIIRFRLFNAFKPALHMAIILLIISAGLAWGVQVKNMNVIERMTSADMKQAIAYVAQDATPGTIVTNSYSLSLYVAAITQHKTAWSQVFIPPPRYTKQHSLVICIFGWVPCDRESAIAELDASYIVIDKIWPSYGKDIRTLPGLFSLPIATFHPSSPSVYGFIWDAPKTYVWTALDNASFVDIVFQQGTVVVYKIRSGGQVWEG